MPRQKTARYKKGARVLPYATEGEGQREGGGNTAASKTTMQDSHFLNILLYIYIYRHRTQVLTQKAEHSVNMRHNWKKTNDFY